MEKHTWKITRMMIADEDKLIKSQQFAVDLSHWHRWTKFLLHKEILCEA